MTYFTQQGTEQSGASFPYADWVESTLGKSSRVKYEETYRHFRESFRDMYAKHLEFLELQSRQSEEDACDGSRRGQRYLLLPSKNQLAPALLTSADESCSQWRSQALGNAPLRHVAFLVRLAL